ncbi:MAG: GHMP kinase [Oscillospiraceae bacterium]|jgi:D-glycero-alpha-D-manno-heptose-7-phosphate kinase|nr:GHMP kinase [Oscillospiraceae bacterium]
MVITKTPLRASFFGGGTDFAGYYENSKYGYGTVLSACLDMNVYITVNKKFDDMVRVVYNGNELVSSAAEVKHNIIREAMKTTGIEKGIEIIYMADIPLSNAGLGLASSSALAVGVLNALYSYLNCTSEAAHRGFCRSPEVLARQAIDIEINKLGQRIGIQDQFAVAYGGFNQYKFFSDGTVSVTPILCEKSVMEQLKSNLMLFYTGTARDSHKILNEQSDTIQDKTAMLDDLVMTAEQAVIQLQKGNVDFWGEQLHRTWQIKKQFASGVSNPQIDDMYTKGTDAGALGGKILGAGGGGFMLFYVPKEKQADVSQALKEFQQIPFKFSHEGSRVVFVD